MRTLSIDIETYSSIDLASSGVYKYAESEDFEILLFAYAYDDGPVEVVDLICGDELSNEVLHDLTDPNVIKRAYNAQFERTCLSQYLGQPLDPAQWQCTMALAAMLGLPGSLGQVSQVLQLSEQKMVAGKLLIRYFSMPCKPTQVNGGRERNYPWHDMDKWKIFVEYNRQDVETERAIANYLKEFPVSDFEQPIYALDQRINDAGIKLDMQLVDAIVDFNNEYQERLAQEAREITGLENPNSNAQLKQWITQKGLPAVSLNKEAVSELLANDDIGENVHRLLEIRQEMGKTSVKKYETMQAAVCADSRIRGVLQYYGANRTGRWAGRLVQVQNLPRNYLKELDAVRTLVKRHDFEIIEMLYDNPSDVFSQLIRTAFIAPEGMTFVISDFSAIEARVIAWLAEETWRQEVFATHGKIYEASAAQMFHVPIEEVTKDSDYRRKGKIAELALGYQGSVGALAKMGGEKMGLDEDEMADIVKHWRAVNRNIVKLWKQVETIAKETLREGKGYSFRLDIQFEYFKGSLFISLPSGRKIAYYNAKLTGNGRNEKIKYEGMDQTTKKWTVMDTYGGKLVENIVQAIARDCLAVSMLKVTDAGYTIVMHIHDEVVVEVPTEAGELHLKRIKALMDENIPWASGLKLNAEAFVSDYYLKD
ncbi:MAG TPA: hypothetical protein DCM01_09195 [Dielma fastidiosa]|nr:hypothetical protein [Dielma fastidiosa]